MTVRPFQLILQLFTHRYETRIIKFICRFHLFRKAVCYSLSRFVYSLLTNVELWLIISRFQVTFQSLVPSLFISIPNLKYCVGYSQAKFPSCLIQTEVPN